MPPDNWHRNISTYLLLSCRGVYILAILEPPALWKSLRRKVGRGKNSLIEG